MSDTDTNSSRSWERDTDDDDSSGDDEVLNLSSDSGTYKGLDTLERFSARFTGETPFGFSFLICSKPNTILKCGLF